MSAVFLQVLGVDDVALEMNDDALRFFLRSEVAREKTTDFGRHISILLLASGVRGNHGRLLSEQKESFLLLTVPSSWFAHEDDLERNHGDRRREQKKTLR